MPSRSNSLPVASVLLPATLISILLAPAALGQQPTQSPPTLDCGGGPSYGTSNSGTRFALNAAIGQHAAATPIGGLTGTSATGVTFRLVGGASPGAPPPPPCPADFNHDGRLDPDDLSDYINAYFNIPPDAGSDFNHDGRTDPDDLSDYINAFFEGGC